jgi:hypothetical protein
MRAVVSLLAGLALLGVTGAELGANARLFWQDHMDD